MITVNMPGTQQPLGTSPRDLESDVVYAVITSGENDLDGCYAVLSADQQFVLVFGDDSFVEAASIEWCLENNVLFQATDLEMVVSFNSRIL